MRRRKFLITLLGVLLIVPLFLGLMQTAQAAESDNVTIELHKLAFTDDEDHVIKNTGEQLNDLQGGTPLSGITFSVYDVTEAFYKEYATGETAETIQSAISKDAKTYATAAALKGTITTNSDGIASFSLPKKSESHDAVYLFVEEQPADTPTTHIEAGDPFVISLPIYVNNAELNTIMVYPKNRVTQISPAVDGKRFVKVDKDNENKTLAGAEFIFLNEAGEYLVKAADEDYEWDADPDPSSLVIQTSDKNGAFSIENLEYGKYSAKEIKAPDGYVQSDQLIPFTIKEGSGDASLPALKVVNVKKTTPSTTPSTTPHGSTTPGGKNLPKAGEVRTSTLSLIGLLIVAAAVLIYFWRKRALDKK